VGSEGMGSGDLGSRTRDSGGTGEGQGSQSLSAGCAAGAMERRGRRALEIAGKSGGGGADAGEGTNALFAWSPLALSPRSSTS